MVSLLPCECIQSTISWILLMNPCTFRAKVGALLALPCLASKGLDDAEVCHLGVYNGTIYFEFSSYMTICRQKMVQLFSLILWCDSFWVCWELWTPLLPKQNVNFEMVPSLLDAVYLILCWWYISLLSINFAFFLNTSIIY